MPPLGRRGILWLALLVQAALLAPRLDLLPLWDDERYTLDTAARPPAGIVRAVNVDVHPPFYYVLVHAWLKLPLPGGSLERARLFSVMLAGVVTILFHRFYLRRLPWNRQALFLGLWVLSPCVVLYGRMARSYMLQMAVAVVAIHFARRWLREPGNRKAAAGYVAASAVLLYIHYLPGLAVVGSVTALGLWRRRWSHLAAAGTIAVLYLPWLGTLVRTAGMVQAGSPHWLGANWAVENILKLSYAFVAFQFGETIPPWAMAVAAALLPAVVWALWRAWRAAPHPPVLFLLLAGTGYFVAASWVSFAFVGARLLFLLPFYLLFLVQGLDIRTRRGVLTYAGLIVVAAGGLSSYYRKQDFLNKGYLVDFQAAARAILENNRGERAAVLLDPFASSAGYYLHDPSIAYLAVLQREEQWDEAIAAAPRRIWYVHYARTKSAPAPPGRLLSSEYSVRRRGFIPYSALDRRTLRILGTADPPRHVLEVLEFRPR